jgi:hypothetical protein
MQVRREIQEFNREFLELVCGDASPGAGFGLAAPVRERLRLLTPVQLQHIADTPCLLAAFAVLPPRLVARGVADAPVHAARTAQAETVRLFAASLLAWLWHTARQDRLLAALCIGPGVLGVEHLRSAGLRDLQRAAAGGECLEARFCRHPRLWPDLVRAAGIADPQVLTATRLSIIQLTLISRS